MTKKNDHGADEMEEKLDESDRRVFLKKAAKAAGAMALFSTTGALVGGEAVANEIPEEGGEPLKKPPIAEVRNMRMNIANKSKSRELSFSGRGLGEAFQAQGLIPASVKNLNNVSIHVIWKW